MMAVNRLAFFLVAFPLFVAGQPGDTSNQVNTKRLKGLVIGSTIAYGITLVGLNELWFENSGKQSFQFFNDNAEWKQVDKAGHFFSAYYLSYGFSSALRWCNVKPKKSELIGALVGFGMMVPIEIMDGFSEAYGASTGDLIADAAGAALFWGQARLWNEQRIYPKFSFHQTEYAAIRPSMLGDGWTQEILKDYNGQTYWLSFDMDKFVRFPRWLNLAIGYGAEGMVYARDSQNIEAGYAQPYRQYYFSLDFDLRAIRSRSKAVNALIFIASMIKLPSPTLEFSSKGVKAYAFYF
jgi:uncharacterized protein YfiM (DUF2279 family)